MKDFLKRLFIKLPLFILFSISVITLVIPLFYWIITGNDYLSYFDDIIEM